MPAGRRRYPPQEPDTPNITIYDKINDVRRIIFLIITEPRSGILPFIQYTTLMILILLANLILIMQTNARWQYTPTECVFCDNGNETDVHKHNYDSEIFRNNTGMGERVDDYLSIECICPPTPYPIYGQIEGWCIYYFSIEWVLRITCYVPTPTQLEEQQNRTPNFYLSYLKLWAMYLIRFNTIIDFLATFSYYLIHHSDKATGLRALRLLRVLRLFQLVRVGSYSGIFISLGNVFQKSMMSLTMLCIVLLFGAVFFGSMIFFFEKGVWMYTDDTTPPSYQFMRLSVDGITYEISPYKSITGSFWWFIVTATTVGYGDYYPTSVGGKIVAVFAMLLGLLVVAFPVSIFSDLWSKELKSRGLLRIESSKVDANESKKQDDNNIAPCDSNEENNNPLFQIIHNNHNNELFDHGSNNNQVLHDLMQQFNKQQNDRNITFNQSDINSLYYHWTMIQNSQNEICSILTRNLLQQQRIRDDDDDDNNIQENDMNE